MRGKLAVALLLILLVLSFAYAEVYYLAEEVLAVLGSTVCIVAVSAAGLVAYLAVTEPPTPPWAGHFPFSRARTDADKVFLQAVRNDVHPDDNEIDYGLSSRIYLTPLLLS